MHTANLAQDDLTLLGRWRDGDLHAGGALLARYTQPLLRFFQHRTGTSAERDELLQATFLACIESRQRIRAESSFRTYLFTIARHELFRYYRQRARRQKYLDVDDVMLIDPQLSGAERLAQRQDHAELHTAIAQLSAADRTLLQCFYVDDIDSGTLALQLGRKPSSIRARLHRARRTLLRHIDAPVQRCAGL